MKQIAYTRLLDGGTSIINPCINEDDPPGFTEDDALARAYNDVPPGATNVQEIDDTVTPLPGRRFRNAWILSSPTSGVLISFIQAREIFFNELRERRAPLFLKADIAYLRALEVGDTTEMAALTAYKNKLRDVTDHPDLLAASTIAELEALTFESLTA